MRFSMPKPPKISATQAKRLALLAFAALLLAFSLYVARFIERTSFEVGGKRYFALFDDAMISMQYAKNLAHGAGLVWNAGGDRVEGFSNPLWVFYMAFWHLFPIPSNEISLPIQISGAVLLFGNLIVVKKIADELMEGVLAPLLAVFLTAFYFHLNNWSLQGMEVSALVLLLSAATLLALRSFKAKRFSVWPYALLTIGTLVRVDMVVPMVVLTAFLAWKDPARRKQHLSWGLGLLAASVAMQTIARRWYYGDWLPNTYYLKVVGVPLIDRLKQGWSVFWEFVWGSGWFLMVIPVLLLLIWPDPPALLLFSLLLGQIAYSIYVGGDAWEHKGGANRFIAIAMPLFFILFVQTLDKIRRTLVNLRKGSWTQLISHLLLTAFVFTGLFSFNVINENDALEKWTLIKRPIFVPGTERYVTMGLLLNQITDPEAKIAVATAGNIIYFADRAGVDMLGKSDRVIAHSQPHANGGVFDNVDDIFRPGHNKWDYQHSIVDLQPDIVAQIWGSTKEMAPYLAAGGYEYYLVDGFPFYIRTNSIHVLWDVVNSHLQK
jgi:membrane protein YdbS with pleckstrin-like domain